MLAGRLSRHHRASFAFLVLFFFFTLAFAHTVFAQITAATVSGTIKDQTGAVLPGVDVVVKNADTGLTRSGVTDANGYFTMPGLPPGTYETRASLQGFRTAVERVTLEVAQEAGLNLTLYVAGTEESITVVGVSSMVDTRSAAMSAVVTEKTISELPLNGRNYIDLALLQPGVANFSEKDSTGSSNRGTKLNINGMSFRSNSYLLDGANMRGYSGTGTVSATGTTLGLETIQEFRVVTNVYSADYGRAMGGVISLVTKSGSNTVHGSGFEFFRDSAMDARNFFDRGAEPPPFRRNQFGASVGGPIRKNRLFFFGGTERLVEDLGITTTSFVPNDAARSGALGATSPTVRPYLDLFPRANGGDVGVNTGIGVFSYERNQPTRETFYQGRADYTASARDSVFARYTYDGAGQTVTAGFPDYAIDLVSRNQFLHVGVQADRHAGLAEHHAFLAQPAARRTVARVPLGARPRVHRRPKPDGRDQRRRLDPSRRDNDEPAVEQQFLLDRVERRVVLEWSPPAQGRRAHRASPHEQADGDEHSRQLYICQRADAPRGHSHALRRRAARGRARACAAEHALRVLSAGRLPRHESTHAEPRPPVRVLHAADRNKRPRQHAAQHLDGHVVHRGPAFRRESVAQELGAARVGFVWDVNGDGRTAIRAGAGLYHDTDGPFNSAFGIAGFSPPFAATATITNPTFPRPASLTADAASARTLDYNIKQPYGLTFNVSAQRGLAGRITATVGYAGSRAYNLMSAIEANPFVPQIQADGARFFPPGAPRRNPAFGPIDYRTNGGHSEYHSLQLSAQKRFSSRYQLQAAYTLSKAMDNEQGQLISDVNNSSVFPQDPYDREIDWARSDFDVRHVFSSNFVWDLPGREGHALLGGWQFNGIVTLRSGVPFTPALGATNWSRSGNTSGEDRPNLRPGVNLDEVVLGGPDRYFDTSAFVLGPQGFFGNAGRNSLTGPNYAMTSVSLTKNTRVGALGAGGQVQFRLEVFNLFNRPNFATPDRTIFAAATPNEAPLATAGRINRTITSSRQVQLGVKVLF